MTNSANDSQSMTHSQFLTGAGLFEGGLLLAAFVLGWLFNVDPTGELQWSLQDFGFGLLAVGPLLLLLAAAWISNSSGLQQIRIFLRDVLGPLLNRCRWIDIVFLALLAGICEEVLFRGFLYQWIRPWNFMLAVVITNLIFAAAHAITPLYALLAGFAGLYLTALMAVDRTPNLLVPLTTHAVYDFIAFLVVLWDYRRHQRQTAELSDETNDEESLP
jgi:membrane protease YdiL (CAAX protease family)